VADLFFIWKDVVRCTTHTHTLALTHPPLRRQPITTLHKDFGVVSKHLHRARARTWLVHSGCIRGYEGVGSRDQVEGVSVCVVERGRCWSNSPLPPPRRRQSIDPRACVPDTLLTVLIRKHPCTALSTRFLVPHCVPPACWYSSPFDIHHIPTFLLYLLLNQIFWTLLCRVTHCHHPPPPHRPHARPANRLVQALQVGRVDRKSGATDAITALHFDRDEELVWVGTSQGMLSSFYSTQMSKYTAVRVRSARHNTAILRTCRIASQWMHTVSLSLASFVFFFFFFHLTISVGCAIFG
jgi:hypothetical protein